MIKDIKLFIIQIIVTSIIYGVMVWLFNVIFDNDAAFRWSILLQAIIFALLYVPISHKLDSNNKKQPH